ncbi:hypothetical protein ACHQM5_012290 [Ranunculus cassubicifolius]
MHPNLFLPRSTSVTMKSPEGLEASLLQLMHDHHQSSHTLRQQTEKAKKDALRCAARVSDILVDAVNGEVQESFINEKRIELEIRAFSATVSRYSHATDQWLAASQSINSALKEIGDFENWMKIMDYDCRSINAAIQNIYQA